MCVPDRGAGKPLTSTTPAHHTQQLQIQSQHVILKFTKTHTHTP